MRSDCKRVLYASSLNSTQNPFHIHPSKFQSKHFSPRFEIPEACHTVKRVGIMACVSRQSYVSFSSSRYNLLCLCHHGLLTFFCRHVNQATERLIRILEAGRTKQVFHCFHGFGCIINQNFQDNFKP